MSSSFEPRPTFAASERAVNEGFTFPLVLVAVGADGQVIAFRDIGEGPATPLCADVTGMAFVEPINILIVDSTGKGSHVVIDLDIETPLSSGATDQPSGVAANEASATPGLPLGAAGWEGKRYAKQ